MKIVVAIIGLSLFPLSALAENVAPANRFDAITQAAKDYVPTMPSVSLPSMPDFSLPDFSKMGDGVMTEFMSFTQQVGDTIPVLQEMGYEVSTFRVQWGLPPKAKLRLRSKGAVDAGKLAAIQAKAPAGVISSALVTSAATAKRIQAAMKMGTAILDVDFAVPPKVRMSFQPGDAKPPAERDVEDLDLACGQALAGN